MAKKLNTQNVVGTLSAAGFFAAKYSRRTGQTYGYAVRQHGRAVTVWSDYHPKAETAMEYSARMEAALVAAGFKVSRPFGDQTILGVEWAA